MGSSHYIINYKFVYIFKYIYGIFTDTGFDRAQMFIILMMSRTNKRLTSVAI